MENWTVQYPSRDWTVQYAAGRPMSERSVTPADSRDERRSTRKREAILEAATTAFLRNGYLGTSMDEIAALAARLEADRLQALRRQEAPLLGDRHRNGRHGQRPGPERSPEPRRERRRRGRPSRPGPPPARDGDAAEADAAAPAGDRRGGALPGARPDLLRARPATHGRARWPPPSSASPSAASSNSTTRGSPPHTSTGW